LLDRVIAMDEHKGVVQVTIYGQQYPIKGNANEEYIRKIASFVDTKMREVETQVRVKSSLRIAVLTALNIAAELFTVQEEKEQLEALFEEKTQEITEVIDQGLKESL
jgi:cell division protein ZapA